MMMILSITFTHTPTCYSHIQLSHPASIINVTEVDQWLLACNSDVTPYWGLFGFVDAKGSAFSKYI